MPAGAEGRDALATFMNPREEVRRARGANLPHWTQDGATYAITFRQADSLPQEVLTNYRLERERLEQLFEAETGQPWREHPCSQAQSETAQRLSEQLDRLYSEKIDRALDAGHGSCQLKNPAVAQIVSDTLDHFDGERYDILAWCLMPNHVHVIARPREGHSLQDIQHSWKSFTAQKINALLKQKGNFWQEESYDHLIRDEEDFFHQKDYVLNNPVAAGLGNWAWVGGAEGRDALATDVTLADLVPFIDWSPFFHTWELRGRFPKIFDDPEIGAEAKKVYDDAQALLKKIVDEELFTPRGTGTVVPRQRDRG